MRTDQVIELARLRQLLASGEAAEIRLQSRLSLPEMAAAVGVAAHTVARWERLERTPRPRAALRYLALLDKLSHYARPTQGACP